MTTTTSTQSTTYYKTDIEIEPTKSTINLDVEQTIDQTATSSSTLGGSNHNIISKQNDTTELLDDETENPNETINDDAYIIPIQIILNSEHAHLLPDADNQNGTKYVKFDYILLRTNDSTAHEHLINDKTEFLKIDETFESSLLNTTTNSTRKYFVNEKTGQHYESNIEHKIFNENGKIAVQFDELKFVKNKQDEEDDTLMSGIMKHEETIVDAVSPTSSDIDQKNDEHYGKILQWIHFNL